MFKENLIDSSDQRPKHCIFYDVCTQWDDKCNEAYSQWMCEEISATLSLLNAYSISKSKDHVAFSKQYLTQLYLIIERIFVVLKILDIKDNHKFEGFYRKNFGSFRKIHKRVNFFKHPNYFVFCHSIEYWIDGIMNEPQTQCWKNSTTIDDTFVQSYYSSDSSKKDSELKEKLKTNICVKVRLPNIYLLTEQFCKEFLYFFQELLSKNPFFIDIIKDHSFIEDYFNKMEMNDEK